MVRLTDRAQEYYTTLYGGPDDDPIAIGAFAPPVGGFLVGYLDDRPVAMGGWTFSARYGEQAAQLRRMFVTADARRHGFAGEILSALERDAIAHGARSIILATGRPQIEAIAFYRSRGYTDVPDFGYYAGSPQIVCLGKSVA